RILPPILSFPSYAALPFLPHHTAGSSPTPPLFPRSPQAGTPLRCPTPPAATRPAPCLSAAARSSRLQRPSFPWRRGSTVVEAAWLPSFHAGSGLGRRSSPSPSTMDGHALLHGRRRRRPGMPTPPIPTPPTPPHSGGRPSLLRELGVIADVEPFHGETLMVDGLVVDISIGVADKQGIIRRESFFKSN
ncbi:unnamed protein product, partial [Urochloa humidicola]